MKVFRHHIMNSARENNLKHGVVVDIAVAGPPRQLIPDVERLSGQCKRCLQILDQRGCQIERAEKETLLRDQSVMQIFRFNRNSEPDWNRRNLAQSEERLREFGMGNISLFVVAGFVTNLELRDPLCKSTLRNCPYGGVSRRAFNCKKSRNVKGVRKVYLACCTSVVLHYGEPIQLACR